MLGEQCFYAMFLCAGFDIPLFQDDLLTFLKVSYRIFFLTLIILAGFYAEYWAAREDGMVCYVLIVAIH